MTTARPGQPPEDVGSDERPPVRRPELLALLRTVRESPDDPAPRLVVADWLEEYGDESDRARAEYIRLCVAVPRVGDGSCDAGQDSHHDRLRELSLRDSRVWLGPLHRWGGSLPRPDYRLNPAMAYCRLGYIHGGFVRLGLHDSHLLRPELGPILQTEVGAWVDHLAVYPERHALASVAASPLLGMTGSLMLYSNNYPDLGTVLTSEYLSPVRSLTLNGSVNGHGIPHLASSPHFGNLRVLDLSNEGSHVVSRAYARLDTTAVDRAGVEFGIGLPVQCLHELSKACSLQGVRRLLLDRAIHHPSREPAGGLTAGVAALFNSPSWPSLRSLHLSRIGELGDDEAEAIAAGTLGDQLVELDLSHCGIGPRGLKAITHSDRLANLKRLDLRGNTHLRECAPPLRERFGGRVLV